MAALLLGCTPNVSVNLPSVAAPRPSGRLSPQTQAAPPAVVPATARAATEPTKPELNSTPVSAVVDFPDRETVRYDEFVDALRALADATAEHPSVRAAYDRLLHEHHLSEHDLTLQSFSRVRLVFEATRDGGYWGLIWGVTNRMPRSDAIWQAWQAMDWSDGADETATSVTAECDELSALFALLTRDLGIQGFTALYWPTWNHTVAVWQIDVGHDPPERKVRLVVPTSQIWLSRSATLGTREFKANHVVFPYKRKDMRPDSELPVRLVRFLLEKGREYVNLDAEATIRRRNQLGGS